MNRRLSRRGWIRARYNLPGWADGTAPRKHLSFAATIRIAAQARPWYRHITWWTRPWCLCGCARDVKPTGDCVYLGAGVVGPSDARNRYAGYRDFLVVAQPQSGEAARLAHPADALESARRAGQ